MCTVVPEAWPQLYIIVPEACPQLCTAVSDGGMTLVVSVVPACGCGPNYSFLSSILSLAHCIAFQSGPCSAYETCGVPCAQLVTAVSPELQIMVQASYTSLQVMA